MILRDVFNGGVISCITFSAEELFSLVLYPCHIPFCSGLYLNQIFASITHFLYTFFILKIKNKHFELSYTIA